MHHALLGVFKCVLFVLSFLATAAGLILNIKAGTDFETKLQWEKIQRKQWRWKGCGSSLPNPANGSGYLKLSPVPTELN